MVNLKKIVLMMTRKITVNDSDFPKIDRLKNFGLIFSKRSERSHEITTDLCVRYIIPLASTISLCANPLKISNLWKITCFSPLILRPEQPKHISHISCVDKYVFCNEYSVEERIDTFISNDIFRNVSRNMFLLQRFVMLSTTPVFSSECLSGAIRWLVTYKFTSHFVNSGKLSSVMYFPYSLVNVSAFVLNVRLIPFFLLSTPVGDRNSLI